VQRAIKGGVRAAVITFVCDAQIQDEGDRPRSVRQVSRQPDVPTLDKPPTLLTPAAGHIGCLDRDRCAEELSKLLHGPGVRFLVTQRIQLKPLGATSRGW
jgi:hypothetical protein